MNDKVLWQLLDTIRGTGAAPSNALSLVLQLLCWWKLSKEPVLPEHLHFEALCEQSTSAQLEALRSAQQYTRHPFLDEGAWQGLHGASDLSALIQKIRLLGTQGLIDTLLLDDAAGPGVPPNSAVFAIILDDITIEGRCGDACSSTAAVDFDSNAATIFRTPPLFGESWCRGSFTA